MAKSSKKSSRRSAKPAAGHAGFVSSRPVGKMAFKGKIASPSKFKKMAFRAGTKADLMPLFDLSIGLRSPVVAKPRIAVKPPPSRQVKRYTPPASLFMSAGLEKFVQTSDSLQARVAQLAKQVEFTVATETRSGTPIQSSRGMVGDVKLDDLRPTAKGQDTAVKKLETLGLTVLRRGRFGITVRGSARLVEELIDQPLAVTRMPPGMPLRSLQSFGGDSLQAPTPQELFLVPKDSLSVVPAVKGAGDHFVFAPPATNFQVAATAPAVSYHTLDAKAVRRLLKVDSVSSTAAGVKLAVIDTGFAMTHPYYASFRAQIRALASSGGPPGDQDAAGHGTAILWNALAVAPSVQVLAIRYAHTPYQDALEVAADNAADIISCSWGWPYEQSFPVLEATIRSIVEEDGRVVLFAAGNGQQAWPASMPQVIAIGGVYADEASALQASSYASGYMSSLYPGRQVPDVSGLCGQAPKGIYLSMPCPAGCPMDVDFSGPGYPDQDTTGPQDGWVMASGTSSATPQIAAVLALLMEKTKVKGTPLNTALARQLLTQSATPVTQGRNAMGFPAVGHPNVACGYGLVDAERLFAQAAQQGYI